jgi:hypothetical protein
MYRSCPHSGMVTKPTPAILFPAKVPPGFKPGSPAVSAISRFIVVKSTEAACPWTRCALWLALISATIAVIPIQRDLQVVLGASHVGAHTPVCLRLSHPCRCSHSVCLLLWWVILQVRCCFQGGTDAAATKCLPARRLQVRTASLCP